MCKIETACAIQSATLRTCANTTALQCVAWIEEGENSETERQGVVTPIGAVVTAATMVKKF